MTTLLLSLLLQAEPMTGAELNRRIEAFAKNGGGDLHVVAITPETNRPKYTFSHWGGFFTTEAIRATTEPLTRPSPPYLLVCNHPHDRESKNQEVVEELVRWEPDGTLVTTGIIYAKWGGPEQSSEKFKAAVARLLKKK